MMHHNAIHSLDLVEPYSSDRPRWWTWAEERKTRRMEDMSSVVGYHESNGEIVSFKS